MTLHSRDRTGTKHRKKQKDEKLAFKIVGTNFRFVQTRTEQSNDHIRLMHKI